MLSSCNCNQMFVEFASRNKAENNYFSALFFYCKFILMCYNMIVVAKGYTSHVFTKNL